MGDPALGPLTDAVAGVEPSISADVDDERRYPRGAPHHRTAVDRRRSGQSRAEAEVQPGRHRARRGLGRRPGGPRVAVHAAGREPARGRVSCRYTRTSPAAPSCSS